MSTAKSPRPWSAADLKKMRALARRRISARVAAKALRRSPGAVRFKACMIGVRFRSIERAA